jgi:ABC-type phosphate transport system permease subunit
MSSATRSNVYDRIFRLLCGLCVVLPLAFGAWFVLTTLVHALPGLSDPTLRSWLIIELEIGARIVGSALAVALPLGIAAAVHLEHYATRGVFTSLAERSLALLAAVPSVLYGIFGLGVYSSSLSMLGMDSFILAVFLFPVIVMRARVALRTVPSLVHEASLSLGADPWRALVHVVLPLAMPTLVAEVLLILARALGTAAPLLVARAMMERVDPAPKITFEPLAVRIFLLVKEPRDQAIAAAAVVVLLALVIVLHALAHAITRREPNAPHRPGQDGLSERGVA